MGAELPRYELIGRGLRVHFKALESALIDPPKAPNRQNVGKDVGLNGGLADKILILIEEKPEITIPMMAERVGVTTRTIEREIKRLRDMGRIELYDHMREPKAAPAFLSWLYK